MCVRGRKPGHRQAWMQSFFWLFLVFFFTARKRSLRRLWFHRYLSVHGGRGLCPQGGVSVQGVFLSGGFCPGWGLCHGNPRMVTCGRYTSYWNAFSFFKLKYISLFCWATDTPVLNFWLHLSWDSPPVWHLLTYWWPVWQPNYTFPHTCQ